MRKNGCWNCLEADEGLCYNHSDLEMPGMATEISEDHICRNHWTIENQLELELEYKKFNDGCWEITNKALSGKKAFEDVKSNIDWNKYL